MSGAIKTCLRCGRTKPLQDYHYDATKPDLHTSHCAECRRATFRRWYEEHREEWIGRVMERQRRVRTDQGESR